MESETEATNRAMAARAVEVLNRAFAETVLVCAPPSADQSAAIRKIREAVMTANAAIACDTGRDTKL